jgi:hypothetical protein
MLAGITGIETRAELGNTEYQRHLKFIRERLASLPDNDPTMH